MKKTGIVIFTDNVRKRRRAAGFQSAEDFAEEIGVPYGTYRDIEAGTSEGRFETRSEIARALGCTVADLYLDPSEVNQANFVSAGEFLATFAKTPRHIQKIVLMLVYKDEKFLENEPPKVVHDATKLLKALLAL